MKNLEKIYIYYNKYFFMKRIKLTEAQEKMLLSNIICESTYYYVEPDKVLLIKKYLDNNFKRASMSEMGSDGYPKSTPIVGMLDNNGNVIKNMTDAQLFDLLNDKFHNIYKNNIQRSKFIAQIIKDWFYKKITKEGLLSVNQF